MRIIPEENFVPSRLTRTLWTYTRKSSSQATGILLPGLFQTSSLALDAVLFCVVIVLELWGLANLVSVGQIHIVYFFGPLFLDILFAILRHLPQGPICQIKNRLLTLDDESASDLIEQGRLRRKSTLLGLWSHFCFAVIFSIAAVKIYAFLVVQGTFNGLTLAITVSYLAAAMIHTSVTGYFFAAITTELSFTFDHLRRQSRNPATRDPFVIEDFLPTQFSGTNDNTPVAVEKHKLERTGSGFSLMSWGILTDENLHAIINSQKSKEARAAVARAGVENQLAILETPGAIKRMNKPDDGEIHVVQGSGPKTEVRP